jgi:hypothetical protein
MRLALASPNIPKNMGRRETLVGSDCFCVIGRLWRLAVFLLFVSWLDNEIFPRTHSRAGCQTHPPCFSHGKSYT